MEDVYELAAIAAFCALHWFAWKRLFRDTTRGPGRARRAGAAVLVLGPLPAAVTWAAERSGAPFRLQQILAWPGYLWLALSLYLILALLAGELVRPVLRRVVLRRAVGGGRGRSREETTVVHPPPPARTGAGAGQGRREPEGGSAPGAGSVMPAPEARTVIPSRATGHNAPSDLSRRLFVSRTIAGAAAVTAVGTVGYGTYAVLRGPGVKRVTVPLAKLPRAAHGFRITVVSDIHLGPILGRGFAQKVVDTINSTQPDLIAVVGDLIDGSVEDLGPSVAPLAQLTARHGAFFVTGNHEYYSGAEPWVRHVRDLGLRPLENDRTELAHFDLAGVNDVSGEEEGDGPDFARALGDRDRTRSSVLLAHQPIVIHDAVRYGVDLQLSGHTHGGQMWPGGLLASLSNPTVSGLERYENTQLYVTRGAGAWGPPVRVGAPSDITVVELASRSA
ncbi:metallophosphoesterase [Streptomyces adelaidensis]|uniref:metallophosphoesterase n=1 Tax=Streptomyces adelaidensis TaxID=2796465 RepID=UPI0019039C00|nr:metallophosphoesterase [Streptomyces adelaidensis]